MSNDLSLYSWSRAISQKAIAGAGLHLQWHFSVIGLIKLQDLKLIFISLSVFLCLSLSTLLYLPFSIAFISFSYNCTIRLKQFRFFFFFPVCVCLYLRHTAWTSEVNAIQLDTALRPVVFLRLSIAHIYLT